VQYTEITPENIGTFHFHGNVSVYPLTAVIAVPEDEKSGVILMGRYEDPEAATQVLRPSTVMDELLDTILTVQSFVVAGMLIRQGIEPILQLTCRDRNRLALQSDLLGAAALGVENVLLLSGDHARFGDHPEARSVFDLDSVQLLQGVNNMQQGCDMVGKPLTGAPNFFSGAAVSPESEPFELMFQKYRKKVEAGAQFFQTQAVFNAARFEMFMDEAGRLGVPVMAGVLLLKSARMAKFLNANIPGVRVPEKLVERLEKATDPLEEGVAIAKETVAMARKRSQGVHLMTLGYEERIPEILGD
jgi:5,10-methylenetetrahydrofolate reductase